MEQFNSAQILLLNKFIKWKADSAKTAFVNLLEILRCNRDLVICNESKRFAQRYADKETTFDHLIYNGKRYNLVGDTDEEDNVYSVYISKAAKSLTECLTKGIKDEDAIKYLTENCDQILETFKDLSMISQLVEYTGQKGANQFKTKTGYLDIRCSNETSKDAVPPGTILINLKFLKSKPSYYYCKYLKRCKKVDSNQVLVTHNDLDGVSVAILALFNSVPLQEIYSCGYSAITANFADSLSVYEKVYVVDISFGEYTKPNMITLDHHTPETAGHCGTWLFYKHIIPKERHTIIQDRFVELVDVYDEWKNSDKFWRRALALNRLFLIEKMKDEFQLMKMYNLFKRNPFMRFIDLMLEQLTCPSFNSLYCLISTAKDAEIQAFAGKVSSFIKNLSFEVNRDTKCNSYRHFIVNESVPDQSYIAHKLLEPDEVEDVDYVIIEYEKWDKYSLRSIELDLHIFDGFEGHEHAGTIDKITMDKYLSKKV